MTTHVDYNQLDDPSPFIIIDTFNDLYIECPMLTFRMVCDCKMPLLSIP